MSMLATTILSWSPVEILRLCAAIVATWAPITSAASRVRRVLEAIRHRASRTESGIAPGRHVRRSAGVIEVEADAHLVGERPADAGAEDAQVVVPAERREAVQTAQGAIAEPGEAGAAGDVPPAADALMRGHFPAGGHEVRGQGVDRVVEIAQHLERDFQTLAGG